MLDPNLTPLQDMALPDKKHTGLKNPYDFSGSSVVCAMIWRS